MKCISLWRPWGLAIVSGLKTIETRTHKHYRGLVGQRIGIHNTRHWDKDAADIMRPYLGSLEGGYGWFFQKELHPAMAIIGTVYVAEFRELYDTWNDQQAALCTITNNRWGLVLTEPRPLKQPIMVSGKRGTWSYEIQEDLCQPG